MLLTANDLTSLQSMLLGLQGFGIRIALQLQVIHTLVCHRIFQIASMCQNLQTHTYTHTNTYTHTLTHAHIYIHIHTHARTHTHAVYRDH